MTGENGPHLAECLNLRRWSAFHLLLIRRRLSPVRLGHDSGWDSWPRNKGPAQKRVQGSTSAILGLYGAIVAHNNGHADPFQS
ncbi:uncharacterized protein BDW43DRAFT_282498 [Aspergillus alliaceus]|uniref:uncharacterized protein n=1 Tax=Petromyces alliaceus TaxID=209559 RepID=UPI0012A5CAA0|nr:uncharacterized protein BDW43DRAFT_282498 [Aspergillus alliaceus]KAB8231514.1 hypothetical protein BDW43DRAFT_282498 [Aspergillus alliaceus]